MNIYEVMVNPEKHDYLQSIHETNDLVDAIRRYKIALSEKYYRVTICKRLKKKPAHDGDYNYWHRTLFGIKFWCFVDEVLINYKVYWFGIVMGGILMLIIKSLFDFLVKR